MTNFLAIWRRELAACFLSPIAYVATVVFVSACNVTFLAGIIRNKLKITDVEIGDDDLGRLRELQGKRCLLMPSHSGGFEPYIIMHLSKLLGDYYYYLAAMEASNLDWQAIFYGGARHSFTNPGADNVGMEALKYDKSADMRSWAAMRAFFDEIFGA